MRAMNGDPAAARRETSPKIAEVASLVIGAQADHAQPAKPPRWIQLIPAGEFRGRDGRGPFRLADPARVIANTLALRMEAGIPVDFDHATEFSTVQGRPAPAAGWIDALAVRNGAVWGRVEWTPRGAAALSERQYRYLSPVFQFAPDGEVIRLLRAGLTNNPNLYLTAVCAARNPDEEKQMETLLDELRAILGMDEEADAGALLARVRQLVEAASAGERDGRNGAAATASNQAFDPANYVAMADFQRTLSELNALRAARAREQAENAVDEAIRSGRLIPAQREWAIAYCQADLNGFTEFMARQPALVARTGESGFGRAGRVREGAATLSPTELAVCSRLGIAAEDFMRRKSAKTDFLGLNRSAE